ncbi:putative hydrolase of HD superfamily [Desulfobaculum xiamenense]|uniref:Putative hydrolase of HD superfamily n=1 Tax=Desulfobaculum xiamenense TaxID=995050 RepID=A0A846QGX7_9BACT|nr:HD domain-containing protein [Desulfobaculum xiamenense]NJB67481.1 putative hydrolase of HD superfamily [Desulfobaculum xiamenense]
MASIRKSLLQFVFSGAYMKRWNDKLRPMNLCELDKQGHKMMVAWALYVLNSRSMPSEERVALGLRIIEGGLFDYLYRLIITDIKPPVFYQIKANPEHYQRLTAWVLEQLMPRLQPLGPELWNRLEARLTGTRRDDLADAILDAAHLYASRWEFSLIRNLGEWDEERDEIDASFMRQLEARSDLIGVNDLIKGPETPLGHFAHLCGQLRFQTRWSQTPRVPETSVLGHLFAVAAYAHFFGVVAGAGEAQRVNNFFAALFHDLPEVLTRDIISPVKQSVQPIADLIKQYEDSELERRVFGPLREGGCADVAERLEYFLGIEVGSEFAPTVCEGKAVRKVSRQDLYTQFDDEAHDPKDGEMIKICDSLAAFVEAYTALRNGISSDQLQGALWRIKSSHATTDLGDGLHIGAILADFD